ncbi:ArsR/SmtB family transcription factor [Micromonospora carbonacea]|uniref:ArsR/SmtB family transcription factor n=1 Tax=Micromonospora carbonacea TaxID=47853 RepID=UPI003D708491
MHAFDVLGDPVRRRILELLAEGERSAGSVCEVIQAEFRISQPAVSQHLRVLRDSGFATVRPQGARRLYAVDPEPLREVDDWLGHFRRFWTPPLHALATELARGSRQRRLAAAPEQPAQREKAEQREQPAQAAQREKAVQPEKSEKSAKRRPE